MHSVSFWGLVRILDLLGGGVGVATLWRDVQVVAPGRMAGPQVAQGRVRLDPEVGKLLWHLVTRWHDLVRSQHNPKVPASTNRLESWFGRFKPRDRLTRGLKPEAGAHHFVGLTARGMA
jgi:hypothetical protein